MKKQSNIFILIIIILIIILGVLIYYTLNNTLISNQGNNMPEMSNMQGGAPGMQSQNSSESTSASGATEISDEQTLSNKSYDSSTDGESALLIQNGGSATISDSEINKTGNSSDENADFYGTNAGILVNNNGTLDLSNSKIITNGSHANGLFVYGTGKATVTDTTIDTSSNNSGGIMVAGGGTLTANNLTIQTDGNSSASIRSDRGGGTIEVNGGTYLTNGVGSPSIYSTADITVNNAVLTSTKSEGAIVEGANSITLNHVTLIDTNTTLNGNSQTYKNIFLYQSMSGDANEGNATFTAINSTITTNKGDTIFVTNTTATINLESNKFINNDGDFLRIQSGKWGTSGSNGGNVTLNANNQEIDGNIIVDNISTLEFNLTSGSSYTGTINKENQAKLINLKLDSTSKIKLTGDSYVTSLDDEDTSYSNIDFNGYKLYVNGTAIN